MDPLGLISKVLDASGRAGAAIAIAALLLIGLHTAPVSPFGTIDKGLMQAVGAAGVVGFAVALVNIVIALYGWAGARDQTAAEKRERKTMALKNLKVLPPDFFDALRFIKAAGHQRFPADADNDLLWRMSKAFLLEIDDPNWSSYSTQTYYNVPDEVWREIDKFNASGRPIPTSPPWIELSERI